MARKRKAEEEKYVEERNGKRGSDEENYLGESGVVWRKWRRRVGVEVEKGR